MNLFVPNAFSWSISICKFVKKNEVLKPTNHRLKNSKFQEKFEFGSNTRFYTNYSSGIKDPGAVERGQGGDPVCAK